QRRAGRRATARSARAGASEQPAHRRAMTGAEAPTGAAGDKRSPDGSGAASHSDDARRWRDQLSPYAAPHYGRAALCLFTSVVPYVGLTVAMYLLLGQSTLALLLAVPAAIFLVRSFIVFHDCTHGSFLPSRRANLWLGRSIGLFLYVPFHRWRHDHAVHHATAGNLDRRGTGDLHTLTVAEYGARAWRGRLGYR